MGREGQRWEDGRGVKWGGGWWCCCTDLDRQVVGSEGEVVPPDKTWMLCSHVHLQMLKKVNVLLLCICVLREGRGQLATMACNEDPWKYTRP